MIDNNSKNNYKLFKYSLYYSSGKFILDYLKKLMKNEYC